MPAGVIDPARLILNVVAIAAIVSAVVTRTDVASAIPTDLGDQLLLGHAVRTDTTVAAGPAHL